jgi:hypothetical protein
LLDSLNDMLTHKHTENIITLSVWQMAFIIGWPQHVYTLIYNRLSDTFSMGLYHYYRIFTHFFASLFTDLSVFASLNKANLLQWKPESAGISRDSCGYQATVTLFHVFFLIDFFTVFSFYIPFLNLCISLLLSPIRSLILNFLQLLLVNLFNHSSFFFRITFFPIFLWCCGPTRAMASSFLRFLDHI